MELLRKMCATESCLEYMTGEKKTPRSQNSRYSVPFVGSKLVISI